MKLFYSIVLLLFAGSTLFAQTTLEQANEAYTKNDFKTAINLYEQVLKDDGQSSDLYYNLGNAYYKDKQYAAAILNYERALRLSPNNKDARFNLEIAQTRIVDKIEPLDTFFLTGWIRTVENSLSSNGWAIMAIGSFLLFILCLFLYFFTRNIIIRKTGFFAGLFMILVCIVSNIFASGLKERLQNHDQAIVFAPTITIRSTPDESGTALFVLHEGTKVTILSRLGKWSEIQLEDGNRGWIPDDKIEII